MLWDYKEVKMFTENQYVVACCNCGKIYEQKGKQIGFCRECLQEAYNALIRENEFINKELKKFKSFNRKHIDALKECENRK